MLNSKQRAYLKSLSNNISPIFQIGKAGVTPELIDAINEALEKREIIKCKVLNNCLENNKEISILISERTKSQVVQIMGNKITLYKKSKSKSKIELPKN